MSYGDAPVADHFWLIQVLPLAAVEQGYPANEYGRSPIATAAFEDFGSTAAGAAWLGAIRTWGVRTLTTGLLVPPSLAATGSQEI